MTEPSRGEINHYAARPLQVFRLDKLTIGALICNDLWGNPGCTPMPESHLSQQLSDMGAKIIFSRDQRGAGWRRMVQDSFWPFHETNLRIRAQAGKVWIVTADNCHPTDIPCSAPTGVLRPDGNWAVKAPDQGEQMIAYTIELE